MIDDFCYDAMIGAHYCGIKYKSFTDVSNVPANKENIIVGSVEQCTQWLRQSGYQLPEQPSLKIFTPVLGRSVKEVNISVAYDMLESGPIFVKPSTQIKAFTGFVAINGASLSIFSEGYQGDVWVQTVVDIVSEYRVYINNNKIMGVKHYSGDPLIFPNVDVINQAFDIAKEHIDFHSYTLDFGVLEDGSTILIEFNDGWAIGNYGLDPVDYYLFVRDRWLQLTGVRYKMDKLL